DAAEPTPGAAPDGGAGAGTEAEQGSQEQPAGPVPLAVSGRSAAALGAQAERLAAHLETHPGLDPADVAYSLATTRATFEHRAVILGQTPGELTGRLRKLAAGNTGPGIITAPPAGTPHLTFLFTGQGSQRTGMGHDLYNTYPAYRETFDTLTELFDHHLTRHTPTPTPLRDIILNPDHTHLLNQTLYTQPALFTLQVALHHLLATWNIHPTTVAGHSIGAITAAHIAGVLDQHNATALITTRAHLMNTLPPGGAMTAINATETEITTALTTLPPHLTAGVTIAALNTPTSTVISGDPHAVTAITDHFTNQGRKTKPLTVSHAFHSHHMNPILEEFEATITNLTYHPPTIPLISDHTGTHATPEQLTSPTYWTHHLRHPIRFHDVVHTARASAPNTTFLELGP
ncbi:acyltransferase domain-containing protein, partial [Streptomyces anulatus]|uniref:acyltransferase domain-containing protein n=1 Tax=Streptomyces anulatus TaxID=1892 RepID=UPI003443575D